MQGCRIDLWKIFARMVLLSGWSLWQTKQARLANPLILSFDFMKQFQRAVVLHAQIEGDAWSHAVGQRATKALMKLEQNRTDHITTVPDGKFLFSVFCGSLEMGTVWKMRSEHIWNWMWHFCMTLDKNQMSTKMLREYYICWKAANQQCGSENPWNYKSLRN